MAKSKSSKRRSPSTLSDEHQKRVKESDELRAKNPNRVGPDAPKKKATTVDQNEKGGK